MKEEIREDRKVKERKSIQRACGSEPRKARDKIHFNGTEVKHTESALGRENTQKKMKKGHMRRKAHQ